VSEGVGVLRKIHDSGEDETPARVGLLGWEVVIAIGVAMGGVGGGVRHCSHEYVEICIWYFHDTNNSPGHGNLKHLLPLVTFN
jgi:hypothetical protein